MSFRFEISDTNWKQQKIIWICWLNKTQSIIGKGHFVDPFEQPFKVRNVKLVFPKFDCTQVLLWT